MQCMTEYCRETSYGRLLGNSNILTTTNQFVSLHVIEVYTIRS
jgi:hypothetical protein